MDLYPKYKSPFGYQVGDNGIDSYGVDHSGFSSRDEIEYQTARDNRENQLLQMYNQQGVTDNYPQYGTNFWGDAGNNYGFGSSNISSAINTHPAMNTILTPLVEQPALAPIDNTNSYTTESAWGYPNNTHSPYYKQMGEPYNTKMEPEYQIGTLSTTMESNGGKQLWNNGNLDKTGGWSYGTYQIATKNGTMNDYLTHLQKKSKLSRIL